MLNGFLVVLLRKLTGGESQTKKQEGCESISGLRLECFFIRNSSDMYSGAKQVLDFKELTLFLITVTLIASLVGAFAMGMDFPRSNVRALFEAYGKSLNGCLKLI